MAEAMPGPEDAVLRQLPALHYACCHGAGREALDALERIRSASMHAVAAANGTASNGDDEHRARLLLSSALQVADAAGVTPLLYAVQQRLSDVVSALLAAGAHPAQPRLVPSLNSALHVAALKGDLASVRHLVSALASLPSSQQQQQWRQPLPQILPPGPGPSPKRSPPAGGAGTSAEAESTSPAESSSTPAVVAPGGLGTTKTGTTGAAGNATPFGAAAAVAAVGPAAATESAHPVPPASPSPPSPSSSAAMAPAHKAGLEPDPNLSYSAVDLLSANGSTPLLYACGTGHLGAAAVLLKAGADPRRANDDGVTPLMAAASGGHLHVMQLLLRAWQEKNGTGVTASSDAPASAISAPRYSILAAAVRAADANGNTALHYAARRGCSRCLAILLDTVATAAAAATAATGTTAATAATGTTAAAAATAATAAATAASSEGPSPRHPSPATAAGRATADRAAEAPATAATAAAAAPGGGTSPGGSVGADGAGGGPATGAAAAGDSAAGSQHPAEAAEPAAVAEALSYLLRCRNAGGRDVLAEARLSGDAATVRLLEARLAFLAPATSETASRPQGARTGPGPGRSGVRQATPTSGQGALAPERGARGSGAKVGGRAGAEAGGRGRGGDGGGCSGGGGGGEVAAGGSGVEQEGAADERRCGEAQQRQQPGKPEGQRPKGLEAAGPQAAEAAHAALVTVAEAADGPGIQGVAAPKAAAAEEEVGKKGSRGLDDAGGWVAAARREAKEAKQGRGGGQKRPTGGSPQQPPPHPSAAPPSIHSNVNPRTTQRAAASTSQQRTQPSPHPPEMRPPPQQPQQPGSGWKAVLLRPAACSTPAHTPAATPATAPATAPAPSSASAPAAASASAPALVPAPALASGPAASTAGQPTAHVSSVALGGSCAHRYASCTKGSGAAGDVSSSAVAAGACPVGGRKGSSETPVGTACVGIGVGVGVGGVGIDGVSGACAGAGGAGPGQVGGAEVGDAPEEATASVGSGSVPPEVAAAAAAAAAAWESEALSWMQALLPAGGELGLLPRHVCGVGLSELSAAQLEGLEALHRAALAQISDARLALAVGVEVARAEEERLRQLEIRALQQGSSRNVG